MKLEISVSFIHVVIWRSWKFRFSLDSNGNIILAHATNLVAFHSAFGEWISIIASDVIIGMDLSKYRCILPIENLCLHEEITNHYGGMLRNGIRGLWRMMTDEVMVDMVRLWDLVHNHFNWPLRWDPMEVDSCHRLLAKLAYSMLFSGSYSSFDSTGVRPKFKHKFFAWLLVRSKILIADKLIDRNWPCNPFCPLSDQEQETTAHLWLHWNMERSLGEDQDFNRDCSAPIDTYSVKEWWSASLRDLPKQQRRTTAAVLI